jgi:hypothetical protein
MKNTREGKDIDETTDSTLGDIDWRTKGGVTPIKN